VTPWAEILGLYDALLAVRNDPVVRTNRAVALAEASGPAAALSELDAVGAAGWLPWHAARADMLARLGRHEDAVADYDAALALSPNRAEALFLKRRRAASVAA
jgi:RNA polymerase sigma-70 factor (ECF subfamily)